MNLRVFILFTPVYNFLLPCTSDDECSDLSIFGKHVCKNFQCLSLDYIDYKMISHPNVITTTTTTTSTTATTRSTPTTTPTTPTTATTTTTTTTTKTTTTTTTTTTTI